MSINKVSSAKEFVIHRFAKLYPTYWTCVTLTFMLLSCVQLFYQHLGFSSISFVKYAANMTMFQYYLKVKNIDGPYWTLTIEMLFYICILLLYKMKLLKHITTVGFAAVSFIAVNELFLKTGTPFIHQKISNVFPLVNHFPLFFAGILFYKIINKEGNPLYNYLFIAFSFSVQTLLFDKAGFAKAFISHTEYIIILIVYFTLFLLFVNGKLKFIVNSFTVFFGKISYSLYLIHQMISNGIVIPGCMKYLHFNFWEAVALDLCVIISIASLVTFYVEIPAGKKIRNTFYLKKA